MQKSVGALDRSWRSRGLAFALAFSVVTITTVAVWSQETPQAEQPCDECENGAISSAGGWGLFDTTDFPPRWNCGTWSAAHGWTHIIADFLTWLAYLSIPVALFVVARRRPDFPFRNLFLMFAVFIVACGFTHFLEAITFWWPAYRFLGLVKVLTAVVSLWTAVVLARVMPDALALKSPEQFELEVSTRTAELQENQKMLEAARLEAIEASRAKGDFLANMSHEVRTPLTAILGYSSILAEEAGDRETAESADIIHRNGEHLLGILNDVLDLAKIEASKLEIELEPISIEPFVRECVELFEKSALEHQVELRTEFGPHVPEKICSDKLRVRQILMNLLGNALKFTWNGTVRVEVMRSEALSQIHFDIVDTGIGMSPEAQLKIFEAFEQANSSRDRPYGGTGLGLAISSRIAGLLGGSVQLVESREGVGSRFRLTIPMNRDQLPSEDRAHTEAPEVPLDLSATEIVLAEDSPVNHQLIQRMLTKAGAEVQGAYDGVEVCELMRTRLEANNPPDLIIMDMQMPERDGYEATQVVRKLGFQGPILALTAHAMQTHRERCLEIGCDAFETKPIKRRQLLELVAELTSQEQV